MNTQNIKNELSRNCTFLGAWDKRDERGKARGEWACVRMYNRGGAWTLERKDNHPELYTIQREDELHRVSLAMVEAFPTLEALRAYCQGYAEDLHNGYEYNLYLNGAECDFWIRANTLAGENNLYVHAIVKEKES